MNSVALTLVNTKFYKHYSINIHVTFKYLQINNTRNARTNCNNKLPLNLQSNHVENLHHESVASPQGVEVSEIHESTLATSAPSRHRGDSTTEGS